MVLLITYGQTKAMYTNDMSIVRVHGYKDSMKRLDDTAKLRFSRRFPEIYIRRKNCHRSAPLSRRATPLAVLPVTGIIRTILSECRSVHCLPAFLYSLGLTQLFRMVILVLTHQNPLQVGRIHHFFSSNPYLLHFSLGFRYQFRQHDGLIAV